MKKLFKLLKINKLKSFVMILSFIMGTFATVYLLYAISLLGGIENNIRLVFAIILVLIWLCFNMAYYHSLNKKKSKLKTTFVITLIYSALLVLVGHYIIKTYMTVDNMTSKTTTYSSSLVTLSDNDTKDLEDLTNGKIGIIADSTSIDGNEIPLAVIKSKKIDSDVLEYDSYIDLINALLDEEVEYIFVPTNYVVMFQNVDGANFEKLNDDTKIIYTKEKIVKKSSEGKNTDLSKPFTILIMGVDSEVENIANSSFNGDALMLITFNPTTLSTTILSIPRDTYVPIMCFAGNRKNKITHAAWYGETCMIDTIENYTGINIDYYVKINFKGVVKLVDTLGGVEVDVPYSFCEQNSNREWGNNTVYVEEGLQVLSGEQALAFSRNRYSNTKYCSKKYTSYISNDFIRGQHQQTVIRSLLNKMKDVKSLNTITDLLDIISNSMETNMKTSEILSLYNIGKDILVRAKGNVDDLISMQRLYLNGKDADIYDNVLKRNLYNYVVYEKSLDAVTQAMKVNLGMIDPTIIKTFNFSIDEPYEEEVVGRNLTGTSSIIKLPDFTDDSETQARATCAKLGISVTFKYITTGTGTNNTVRSQNFVAGYDVSYVKSLVLTILRKEETKTIETTKTTETTVKVDTVVDEDEEEEDEEEVATPTVDPIVEDDTDATDDTDI